ncbi:MAG: aspartate kinase [Candidatus Obscuribacterales bacterium]|nr:aspartate kinase [Candidatus Obscuribacterales bacterium]
MSNIAVLKFGGTSVKNVQRLRHVASIVKEAAKTQKVIVVVSAMGDATDRLVHLANQCAEKPHAAELDVLLSTGEQVTIALLTILLTEIGIAARSLTGPQAGILTDDNHSDANIVSIDGRIIENAFEQFDVLVIAGFQGATASGKISTLGRGGSDTTAVAVAAAVKATSCDIYTDVNGIYDCDPNKNVDACKFDSISFDECLELAQNGAQVIHPRAVIAARNYNLPVTVRSTFQLDDLGTLVGKVVGAPKVSSTDRFEQNCHFIDTVNLKETAGAIG